MITQKIIARTDSLKLDKIISRYGEDSMRQVVFIIARPDPESEEIIPITIPEDAVGSFRILKPSGNFVIVPMSKSVLASGETAFDVVLPSSSNTAKGSGYYDIRITSDTDKYYFTAQGDFIIDDNIISDEVLEDVSEVNGLIFPDDFYTKNDPVAEIDDDHITTVSTWSSDKINDEIASQIEAAIGDLPSPMTNYSTTPVQVGTWLDGITPVYQRVIVTDFGNYVTAKNIPLSSANDQYVIDFRVYVKPSDADDGLIPAFPSMGYSGSVEAGAGGSLYGMTGVTVTRSGNTAYGDNPQIIIIYKYYNKEV